MSKQLVLWSLAFGVATTLGACASDSDPGSSVAAVQAAIGDCQDELALCDESKDDCEANAMDCMNAVDGDDVYEDDVAELCDELYAACLTKIEGAEFCEKLRQACLDCAKGDDDEDSDSDDSDSDSDDEDSDSDDEDSDRDDEDSDRDDEDDDGDDEDSDRDDEDDNGDCDYDEECGSGGAGGDYDGAGGYGGESGGDDDAADDDYED